MQTGSRIMGHQRMRGIRYGSRKAKNLISGENSTTKRDFEVLNLISRSFCKQEVGLGVSGACTEPKKKLHGKG